MYFYTTVNKQKLNKVRPAQMKHNSDKMTIAPTSSQPCSKPEGIDTLRYKATAESANGTYEDALFSNLYSPTNTITTKPPQFDGDAGNTNVVKLNANGNKTGAGIMLKVMAGDKLQINTFSFYNTPTQAPAPGPSALLTPLLGLLSSGIVGNSAGKYGSTNTGALSNALSPNVGQFLSNQPYNNSKPKAYLNYILFDNQFNVVAENTNSIQVETGTNKQALIAQLQNIVKNGYMYVYLSNESPMDVYFDDLTVTHTSGPLLQENHYYPFGLSMATISDKAALKLKNVFLYNGGAELEDEDGINYYNTFYRKYDAQIGRFTGVDMLAESFATLNPYQFGANNPVMYNDPMGDQYGDPGQKDNGRFVKGTDGQYRTGWNAELFEKNRGFSDWGQGGDLDGYTNVFGQSVGGVVESLRLGQKLSFENGKAGYWERYTYYTGSSTSSWLRATSISEGASFSTGANINLDRRFVPISNGLDAYLSARDWSNSNTALDVGGSTFEGFSTALYHKGKWLGQNGKYNNVSWGGNGRTGARATAFKGSKLFKTGGKAVTGAVVLIGLGEVRDGYIKDGGELGYNSQSVLGAVGGGLVGSEVGGSFGAVIGGAFGSLFFGIGAVPGAAIGTFVGSMLGGYIGSNIGLGVINKKFGVQ